MFKRLLIFSALASTLLSSEEPYFGGTLLSTIPVNIAPGKWLFEPYFYITRQTGIYTPKWSTSSKAQFTSVQMLWEFETGITRWLDIGLFPTFYYTHSNGLSKLHCGDTQAALGFQALRQETNCFDLRFVLQESFPTGKYDRLKNRSQITGSGAYETWLSAIIHKTLLPCTLNLTLNYVIPSNVPIHGLSYYGGDSHTRTTLRPGRQFIANLGIEYSLTQQTMLGLDIHYQHQNSSSKSALI